MADQKSFVIAGARVVDPQQDLDAPRDVLVADGIIEAVDAPGSFKSVQGASQVDASGRTLVPGLVDVHVHLREPGFEWKETVATGCEAAAAGGFTEICCMPNTSPVNDCAEVTQYIMDRTSEADSVRVRPIGAITKGLEGEILSPMLELKELGCVGFSDDGHAVGDASVMRKALDYCKMLDTVLAVHEEDVALSRNFSMNESELSVKLGLVGMPETAENVMIARDIELARMSGTPVHFCHVSTARGVTLIRRAKEDGIPVSAEAAPHYFTLNDTAVGEYDPMCKMNMPLRSEADREAILQGLQDGVIDCIASDHAPHEADTKRREFEGASFGIIGLQTTLPLTLAKVREGSLSLSRAIEALTSAPRRCFKLDQVSIKAGSSADITLIDMERTFEFGGSCNKSKSANSPFWGWKLQGTAAATFVGGRCVFGIE